MTSWNPVEVDVATAGADFWKRYHTFRRLRHAERRPDDPITPDEVVEGEMKRVDPHELLEFLKLYQCDVKTADEAGALGKADLKSYALVCVVRFSEPNKHLLWADGSVHKDHRRRGIGRTWIPLTLEIMDRNGYTTVGMGTEEPSGHAFLKWLGAEAKLTGAENRLKLADVDWAMMRRWVDEGPRRSPVTKFESYDGRLPEPMLDDYCPQLSSLLNTMPFENLDHGEIVVTPAILLEWFARMDLSGQVGHWMMTREPDGTISGITDMFYAPYSPNIVHQGFTGVRGDARGRGLGKWLKAAMAIHLRELYPKAEWFTTDNASSNAPMSTRAIPLPSTYRVGSEYQITRDQLAGRFKELANTR